MTYKVKLQVFEGPLDLLLFLIKKNEVNIHDIPISQITEQYLQYLDLMKMLDLNIAGEFLVMAATLMHIKSKMLLPPDESELAEGEEIDPREELVRKLLEYKRFKEAASQLQDMEKKQKDIFVRPASEDMPDDLKEAGSDEVFFEASIFDLITAFKKVLKEIPKETFYNVVKDEVTVSEKIHHIFHLLVKEPALSFFTLFKDAKSKIEIIAIFLAILELIRMKEITARQDSPFSDIMIVRNMEKVHPETRQGENNDAGKPTAG
ncbi:MAG: segregation/condensation protein A [Candidatus Omnitrophica bacterium]|nr:segregation/condensation protein A [Candidatus Omnitrophota bacterium]